jgi:probable rRNA maturation factor
VIEIEVEAPGWDALDVDALARRAVEAALAVAPAAPQDATVSLLFADDARVRALNREWRGQDKPTNVLSFPAPAQPAPRLLGDVVLALETVRREAEDEGKPLADHAAHLIVHGVLHLLGCDHDTDSEAEAMEALEARALARIGVKNPYEAA